MTTWTYFYFKLKVEKRLWAGEVDLPVWKVYQRIVWFLFFCSHFPFFSYFFFAHFYKLFFFWALLLSAVHVFLENPNSCCGFSWKLGLLSCFSPSSASRRQALAAGDWSVMAVGDILCGPAEADGGGGSSLTVEHLSGSHMKSNLLTSSWDKWFIQALAAAAWRQIAFLVMRLTAPRGSRETKHGSAPPLLETTFLCFLFKPRIVDQESQTEHHGNLKRIVTRNVSWHLMCIPILWRSTFSFFLFLKCDVDKTLPEFYYVL